MTCAHCLVAEGEGAPEAGESFRVSIRGSAPFDARVAPDGWRPGACDLAVLRPVGDLPDDAASHKTDDLIGAPEANGSYVAAPWDDGLGREAEIAARPEGDARPSTDCIVTFRVANAIDQIEEGHSGGPVFSTSGRSRRLVGLVKGVVHDRLGQFEVIDGDAIASAVRRVRAAAAPGEGTAAPTGRISPMADVDLHDPVSGYLHMPTQLVDEDGAQGLKLALSFTGWSRMRRPNGQVSIGVSAGSLIIDHPDHDLRRNAELGGYHSSRGGSDCAAFLQEQSPHRTVIHLQSGAEGEPLRGPVLGDGVDPDPQIGWATPRREDGGVMNARLQVLDTAIEVADADGRLLDSQARREALEAIIAKLIDKFAGEDGAYFEVELGGLGGDTDEP